MMEVSMLYKSCPIRERSAKACMRPTKEIMIMSLSTFSEMKLSAVPGMAGSLISKPVNSLLIERLRQENF